MAHREYNSDNYKYLYYFFDSFLKKLVHNISVMFLEEIKKELLSIPDFIINNVIDNSAKHEGHESIKGSVNKLTHIKILISSKKSKFNRVEIHRTIYKKLNYFIAQGLHSIEIKIVK